MEKTLRNLLLLLSSAFLLFSCSLDIRAERSGSVYMVIAALDYRNTIVSDLNGTVRDALEIEECLSDIYESRGIRVHKTIMIQNGPESDRTSPLYPSSDNILSAIRDLPAGKNDLVVFYYSGHGDVDEDGRPFFAGGNRTEEELYSPLIMDDVFNALDRLPSQCVALIDACYSGGMADSPEDGRTFGEAFRSMLQKADLHSVAVLAASQPDELSYVSSITNAQGHVERHSAFTIGLLQRLGWIHTEATMRAVYADGELIPIYGRSSGVYGSLTAEKLFDEVMASWGRNQNQTPFYRGTPADIYVVPAS